LSNELLASLTQTRSSIQWEWESFLHWSTISLRQLNLNFCRNSLH